jgi:hypothetical protein
MIVAFMIGVLVGGVYVGFICLSVLKEENE